MRPAGAATKTFTYGATTIFPNPERGWFYPVPPDYFGNRTQPHAGVTNDYPYPLTEAKLTQKRGEGMSLVRKIYMIPRGSYIPQGFIDQHLLYDFDLVRRSGFKLVPRFCYVWNTESYDDRDAELVWILRHIEQIMPHLNANLDVLSHMEAGFVGYFAEWHTSKSGNLATGVYRDLNDNSRQIYQALLDGLDPSRMVLMRYPRHVMQLFPEALPDAEKFATTDRARTGMYDDSFRYSVIHRGTYSTDTATRTQERTYQEQITKYVPMSGEPSGDDGTGYVFQDPIPECERMHWRMMNSDWYEARRDGVYDSWRQNGYHDEMNRRFGYRFALKTFEHPGTVRPNGAMQFRFSVENRGFGVPHNIRLVDLVLRHQSTGREYYFPLYYRYADPRYWTPGATHSVSVTAKLPSAAPKGTYNMFLSLPDAQGSLYSDGRYSIRLANNETTWEAAKGYNSLNATFSLSGTPVTADPAVPNFRAR